MDEYTLQEILPRAKQGYCCSQILILLALRAQGRENPELVRAMGALCRGFGACGVPGCGACGIIPGGACVLGLYFRKGQDSENQLDRADLAEAEYVEWFVDRATSLCGGSTCEEILGEPGGRPNPDICGSLLAAAWAKLVEIVAAYGLDITVGRDG